MPDTGSPSPHHERPDLSVACEASENGDGVAIKLRSAESEAEAEAEAHVVAVEHDVAPATCRCSAFPNGLGDAASAAGKATAAVLH